MRIVLIGLMGLMLFSCLPPTDKNGERLEGDVSETGKILQGEHKLRRFKVKRTAESNWSGSYFLIGGSASGGTFTKTQISFSFQLTDSTYAMATLDLQKIRVKLDSTIKTPFVTFRWERSFNDDISTIMMHRVRYMLVHCKEEDFPMDIQIDKL